MPKHIVIIYMLFPAMVPIQNGSVYMVGDIGPGQSFYVDLLPFVYGGKYGQGRYDLAVPKPPKGWEGIQSRLYGNPLRVKIKAAANATPSTYQIPIYLIDEDNGEGLNYSVIYLKVRVIDSPLVISLRPLFQQVGIGQPAVYKLTIKNTGMGAEAVSIQTRGLPREYSQTIYLSGGEAKTFNIITWAEQEEHYRAALIVKSLASGKIMEYPLELSVRATLSGDVGALNDGVIIYPVLLAPFYYFIGMFGG